MLTQFIILEFTTGNWIALGALIFAAAGSLYAYAEQRGRMKSDVKYLGTGMGEIKTDVGIIKTDIVSIKERLSVVETIVTSDWSKKLTVQESPKYLSKYGLKILEESKIAKLIDEYYDEIIKKVKEHNPQNAYQAEEAIINTILSLELKKECKLNLEEAAFKTGEKVMTILYVGAIDVRDRILKEFEFAPIEINEHAPKKKKD